MSDQLLGRLLAHLETDPERASIATYDADDGVSWMTRGELFERAAGTARCLAARGVERGPTPYGAGNIWESYAEAYALWHADPDALRRTMPATAEWFANGGHLAWQQ